MECNKRIMEFEEKEEMIMSDGLGQLFGEEKWGL